jgi:hypothetical protein
MDSEIAEILENNTETENFVKENVMSVESIVESNVVESNVVEEKPVAAKANSRVSFEEAASVLRMLASSDYSGLDEPDKTMLDSAVNAVRRHLHVKNLRSMGKRIPGRKKRSTVVSEAETVEVNTAE